MIDELTRKLSQVRYFTSLPLHAVHNIVKSGRLTRFAAQSTIFEQGLDCAGVYVLVEGKVHLEKLSALGQSSIMSVIEPVRMFNEVPALDQGTNPVTAVAYQDSLVWHVSPTVFRELLLRHPQVALGLLSIMAARNRELVEHYEDLSFRPVMARTAKLLLDLSADGQKPIDRRDHTNAILAARLSTVPEAFSRALKLLRESGAIHCTRLTITILSPDILRLHLNQDLPISA
jgi:CRP-like cAMP-binding protein